MKTNEKLDKYYKILTVIFIAIGLGLIFKLWLVGLQITDSCSGGWISICFGWDFEYFWISAGYIAVILLLISIYLIKLIRKTDNKIKKIQIAILILFLGLISKQIFFLVSPDFKFYFTSVTKQYKDSNYKITDLDKYLELTTKYCDNFKKGDTFDFMYSRETMCSGKFETAFDTVEEYIKILEHAKNNNFRLLYYLVFGRIDENVGLENMINKYEDDTFYAYVIKERGLNKSLKQSLRKKIKNQEILDLIKFYEDSLKKIDILLEGKKYYNIDKFWKDFDRELKTKIKQIPSVNQEIF